MILFFLMPIIKRPKENCSSILSKSNAMCRNQTDKIQTGLYEFITYTVEHHNLEKKSGYHLSKKFGSLYILQILLNTFQFNIWLNTLLHAKFWYLPNYIQHAVKSICLLSLQRSYRVHTHIAVTHSLS